MDVITTQHLLRVSILQYFKLLMGHFELRNKNHSNHHISKLTHLNNFYKFKLSAGQENKTLLKGTYMTKILRVALIVSKI